MIQLPFPKQALDSACLQYKSSENTVGKGEITILLKLFSTRFENFQKFSSNLKLSSANCLSLNQS